jgi:hypothetical protein
MVVAVMIKKVLNQKNASHWLNSAAGGTLHYCTFSFSQVFTSNIHMADYLPVPVSGAKSKQSQQWFEVPTSQVIL